MAAAYSPFGIALLGFAHRQIKAKRLLAIDQGKCLMSDNKPKPKGHGHTARLGMETRPFVAAPINR